MTIEIMDGNQFNLDPTILSAVELSKKLETFQATLSRAGRSAVQDHKTGRIDAFTMRPQDLKLVQYFNTRIPTQALREHIDDLKAKIKANGFLKNHPISVFVQKVNANTYEFWVTDGNCRMTAVNELIAEGEDIAGVPILLEPEGTTLEDITARLVINNSGKSLSLLEVGLVLNRLMSYNYTIEDAAIKTGLKISQAKRAMVLVGAPTEIRALIIAGKVSETLAVDMLNEHGAHAVTLLKQGEAAAGANGKAKVTRKTVEQFDSKKMMRRVIQKHAERLHEQAALLSGTHESVKMVMEDPSVQLLSDGSREAINLMAERLNELTALLAEISEKATPAEDPVAGQEQASEQFA